MTPLIGRDDEIAAVLAMVERERIVTLTGTGGCGKSRLAAEVGVRVAEHFPDGVWWCELAPHREDTAVVQALAEALRITASPGRPLAAEVFDHLASQGRVLLILDNAEHLLDATAAAAVELHRDPAPGPPARHEPRAPLRPRRGGLARCPPWAYHPRMR